ncbi:MAG: Dam family site-specific DNA-(adenine-N6)-methyltransferase [Segetibacter sp.]
MYEAKDVLNCYSPPKKQLLKWIGNKKQFAPIITKHFPDRFNRYLEPFLGSGAILGTVAPTIGIGSDTFEPLIEIWRTLKANPAQLISWYGERRKLLTEKSKEDVYEEIKYRYNKNPNGADFLFLSRACYGGVIRFRKVDNYMSTPCGVHLPISTEAFEERVEIWHKRVKRTTFLHCDYTNAFEHANKGDLIYCDPPYSFSQSILYGAQNFSIAELFENIAEAKSRGVLIALSIDGNKKSGSFICDIKIPEGLFETEILIDLGHSMLRRFQKEGQKMIDEIVTDRLLLTY